MKTEKTEITIADLINKEAVIEKCGGISNSTFYKRVRAGIIPAPIMWPPNCTTRMWIEKEVDAKIAADLEAALAKRAEAA